MASAGSRRTSFLPPTPMKLPITAMSGLKILDAAETLPYTGSVPLGPPAPSAPAGTSAVGGEGVTAPAGCGRRRSPGRRETRLERGQPRLEVLSELLYFRAQRLRECRILHWRGGRRLRLHRRRTYQQAQGKRSPDQLERYA